MASVSGVSSSNMTSSLYNSANVISGLASGLDTESMIEGLVQSYQTKIQNLTNQATKLEWKQEAYRSIISKMYAFTNKYTSFTSSTNLLSSSFFSNAINVATQGTYASKVTASGRTDSDVKLNSVTQLATAARYATTANFNGLDQQMNFSILAEGKDGQQGIDLDGTFTMGTLSGSMVLTYGGKTVSLVFDANTDIVEGSTFQERMDSFTKLINKKLGEATVTLSSGESRAANELIKVTSDASGKITFSDNTTGGNTVYISSASDSVKDVLGLDLEDASEKKPNTIQVTSKTIFSEDVSVKEYASGKTMNISLDGKTKSITLPTVKKGSYDGASTQDYFVDEDGNAIKDADGNVMVVNNENYVTLLQQSMDKAFGTGKIKVSNEATDGSLQLQFKAPDNTNMIINTDAGNALGIGNTATNYLSTSKALGDLMDFDGLAASGGWTAAKDKDGKDLLDAEGNKMYAFEINGTVVGNYSKNSKLSDLMNDINNSEAGVKVTYSQTTRQFTFTSKDTGVENEINISGGMAEAMFGTTELSEHSAGTFFDSYGVPSWVASSDKIAFQFYDSAGNEELHFELSGILAGDSIEDAARKMNTYLNGFGYTAAYNKYSGELEITDRSGTKVNFDMWYDDPDLGRYDFELGDAYKPAVSYTPGQDAKFEVEVNGQTLSMTRSSNSVNIDGMTINFKGTFETKEDEEPVTFQRTTDSDKIVDAIRSMIDDFNEMFAEIRSQYATLPYQNSSGAFQTYEPLSADDMATMSESAIQAYEAKAKQGILFNDSNLSNLYSKLLAIFTDGTVNQQQLSQMGISISYSSTDGAAVLTLDENKLRDMLDNDPDAVADAFTRTANASGATDGIMQKLKAQMDTYAATTGATKGILVEQAGTPLSALSLLSNTWQTQIDNLGDQITKWQEKMTAQVDRYTSMFSKLETLIYQMNSQSSTLAGLMGG